jgi:F0F1-type ATP synthase assembly protein I
MATDVKNDQASSVTSLVSGIVEDAQELLKQQFELFKRELHADARKFATALAAFGIAACVGLISTLLLGITLSLLLNYVAPALPLWAAFAIVTAVFLICGGGLCVAGWAKLRSINPLSDQTAETLKENVQWIMKPK